MADTQSYSVGIVGARGYAGAELIGLINRHPFLSLAYAASRSRAGQPVPGAEGRALVSADPEHVASLDADAVVLAVPDGTTSAYTSLLGDRVVVDLSSDHRFDDAWVYGLSEFNAARLARATRISNPGCYATALQLASRPLLPLIEGPIHAFGVSGYSGAGTTPSDRNNPQLLADGVTPYKPVGHTHEREAAHHLRHPVRFTPCVAPYFRGISLTIQARAKQPTALQTLHALYERAYEGSPMIAVLGERVPRVQDIAHDPGARIGGITLGADGRSIAAVCVIDNLLKGASSQALQNLNLALGLDINTGLLGEVLS